MKPSKWFRLFSLFFAGVVILCVAAWAVTEVSGLREDKLARSASEDATTSYRRQFEIGEPLARVERSLVSLHVNTLHRGDEMLIIAREGRTVWYCSHNYFGTSLRFAEDKLREVVSDEWLETCL